MKKIWVLCLLLGSCVLGKDGFSSSMGDLVRLLGLTETVAVSTEEQTLSGFLKDEDGNAIANATLSLQSESSSVIRASSTTTTDSEGKFSLSFKVGSYKVTIQSSTGSSLGVYSVSATSPTVQPTLTLQSGNLSLTVNNFNNGAATLSPSLLTFGSSSYTFTSGIGISKVTPTVTGTLTSCTARPSLPSGLSLSSTCEISGTPIVTQSSISHLIRGRNSYGDAFTKITITVNQGPPSSLTYSKAPYTLFQGVLISSQTPSYIGTITSCSSSPSLPNGLSLSSACVITGTPNSTSASTNYTITASNSLGQTTTSISISVVSPNNYIVSMPTGLLKTGQTTSYVAGDDGAYQKGVARTFTTGGTSGFIWQRCSAGQNNDATCSGTAQTYNWADANSYCSTLGIGGRAWRLPTARELKSLVDYGKSASPAINLTIFNNTYFTQGTRYWTSNNLASNTTISWGIDYFDGILTFGSKSNNSYVKCISGTSESSSTLTDNGNGTITDSQTGFIWQKCSRGLDTTTCSGNPFNFRLNWSDAISYCENLSLGNRNDWRLPNVIELWSITSLSSTSPAIDSSSFINTYSGVFWSSTTSHLDNNLAWYIDFTSGTVSYGGGKSANTLLRCVTGP